jgi:hypothetical protein
MPYEAIVSLLQYVYLSNLTSILLFESCVIIFSLKLFQMLEIVYEKQASCQGFIHA